MNKKQTKEIIGYTEATFLAFFMKSIKAYQKGISPFLGQNCRHYPSCSNYTIESLNKYGLIKGMLLALARILRCNPWGLGGYDPLPEEVSFNKLSSFKITGNYQTKLYHQKTNGTE